MQRLFLHSGKTQTSKALSLCANRCGSYGVRGVSFFPQHQMINPLMFFVTFGINPKHQKRWHPSLNEGCQKNEAHSFSCFFTPLLPHRDDCGMLEDEITARAPMAWARTGNPNAKHPAFIKDNRRVWELLSALFTNMEHQTCVKLFSKTKDGGGAFLALKMACLGDDNIDNQANAAEKTLEKTTCTRETHRWNFKKRVKTLWINTSS